MRPQLPAISFNTVYKTLETLCRKGLILKVNPLHETARYDGETGLHAHLVCRRCHTIADLYRQPEVPADLDKKDNKAAVRYRASGWSINPLPFGGFVPNVGSGKAEGNLRPTGVGQVSRGNICGPRFFGIFVFFVIALATGGGVAVCERRVHEIG